MERMNPRSRSDAYGSRINRSHSTVLATVIPYISILIASILPLIVIASALRLRRYALDDPLPRIGRRGRR